MNCNFCGKPLTPIKQGELLIYKPQCSTRCRKHKELEKILNKKEKT